MTPTVVSYAIRNTPTRSAEFLRGIRAGLAIALGYFPVAVTFGILARQAGLSSGLAAGFLALFTLNVTVIVLVAIAFSWGIQHFLL